MCISIPGFLPQQEFAAIVRLVETRLTMVRINIAGHKRGATMSYAEIDRSIPEVACFYRSSRLRERISGLARTLVQQTPRHDQSSCSILVYDQPDDRIGWHYDHNFYNGRHFTALLPLINTGTDQNLSSSRLLVRESGETRIIPTPPNALALFEGALVRHCVTPLQRGERRVILSMTFCTDPTTGPLKDFGRRVKDIAYFGIRALWV